MLTRLVDRTLMVFTTLRVLTQETVAAMRSWSLMLHDTTRALAVSSGLFVMKWSISVGFCPGRVGAVMSWVSDRSLSCCRYDVTPCFSGRETSMLVSPSNSQKWVHPHVHNHPRNPLAISRQPLSKSCSNLVRT